MKRCKNFTPIAERLSTKIALDAKTGCYNWTATKNRCGYGQIRVDGKTLKAHRVSYAIHGGKIPKGMKVLHRCDNPACINIEHLFLGTQSENVADKVAKDRQARGADAGNAKLTETDVLAIRNANGVTIRVLAKRYKIGRHQICRIRSGKQWAHLN